MNPHTPAPLMATNTSTSRMPHTHPWVSASTVHPHYAHQHQLYAPKSVVSANRRYLIGLDSRHFSDKGCFDPKRILRWPDQEGLPKIKPIGIPLRGMAFAEVHNDDPPPPAPANPVQHISSFDAYWAAAGPGAYGHQSNPHLDPKALGDLQTKNIRPNWDGRGETVHTYLFK